MAHELLAVWANGDLEAVKRLLQDEHVELDVDYQGYFSQSGSPADTLLLRAVAAGEVEVVELLLARDADVNLENERWETPLHAAINVSHWEIVKTLVEHGADLCTIDKENGYSPLHLAVQRDWVDVVRLILDKDPSGINQRDNGHRTPLHLAFGEDKRNCTRELLKRGATTWWNPPLSVAISIGRVDFARQVLRSRAVDVDEADRNGWTPLHHAADQRYHLVVKLLVGKNADPNRRDKDGFTPLHRAVFTTWEGDEYGDCEWTHRPHLETVQELLACSGVDVNAVTKDGWSALHYAVKRAWIGCLEVLLACEAEVNTVDKNGRTPLFVAVDPRHPEGADPVPCVTRLIDAGADVNASDNKGDTPLMFAVTCGKHQVVELLLQSGADMNAAPMTNHSLSRPQALAVLMSTAESRADCYVAIARNLCARGAKWDVSCDDAVGQNHDADWCSGMRASVEHWAKQLDRGVDSLTDIPIDTIDRGAKSVESYLERVAGSRSKALLQRCKVCVVGPTEWGKTTLVKTLTTGEAASVDPGVDGRTVGIDLGTLKFTDPISDIPHEVTFWDFAGQNEYQGAHSLFFSSRSLYLLCVDLKKYQDALANNKHAMEKFMRDNIFRWVRAVTARHKDAKFVAVGTKLDQVEHERVRAIWKDLKVRWSKWTRKFDVPVELQNKKIVVNNYDPESVSKAVRAIKAIISASNCSIGLPDDDVRVLKWICSKRDEMSALSVADRVSSAMWGPGRLQNELLKDIPNLGNAEGILKLLHDLGDVYWNESDRQDTIVIDPSLLLEFVKEIITHKCDMDADEETKKHLKECRVSHKTLSEFPHWKYLDGNIMYDLKCLLQQLRLAYPANYGEMTWNSDLIVPAYWKRLDPKPSRGLLRDRSVMKRSGVKATFEYWLVYKVPPELSDVVFEQFAVQHRIYHTRQIWQNMIEDSIEGCVATIELKHGDPSTMDQGKAHNQVADSEHSKTSRASRRKESKILDTINLRVAGSNVAHKYLLVIVDAMEKVLRVFKGVGVSRFVKDPTDGTDHEWEKLRKEVEKVEFSNLCKEDFFSLRAWVPPNFKAFFYKPHDRRIEELVADVRDAVHGMGGKMDVLENLLRTTDSQQSYPAWWTLMYDQKQGTVELRMLCELKEKCQHDPKPITINVPSDFLAKNSEILKGCALLMETVVPEGMPFNKLVDKLVSDFLTKIDNSEKIHEIFTKLDLSQGGETLVGKKVSEPIAAYFLHELLTLHDPSFRVGKIPLISGLNSTTNKDGRLIWVHQSGLNPNICVPKKELESQNASSSGVSGDTSTSASHDQSEDSDEPVQQPEEEHDPSSDASSASRKEAKSFSAQLRILGITGLEHSDEREVFCNWTLQKDRSGSMQVICSATTPRHSDKSHAPSWEDIRFEVRNIASLKQLAECKLRVEVKRPHRLAFMGLKDLYRGSTFLAHVENLQCDANPRTIVVVVELDKKKAVFVKCELALA